MFGYEIGMVAQPVAGAFNLDHAGMVEQPVEQRRCHDGITEDVAPFGEPPVRGQDHRALFIPCIDQLEEQVAATAGDRQVADFVDDEQRCPGMKADLLGQSSFPLGLQRLLDDQPRGELDQLAAGVGLTDADGPKDATKPAAAGGGDGPARTWARSGCGKPPGTLEKNLQKSLESKHGCFTSWMGLVDSDGQFT